MNRTFKVAKSLSRGVVVTSEKASSYQGKAVKTVIAAAVASLVAGVAMAADPAPTPVAGSALSLVDGKLVGSLDAKVGTVTLSDEGELTINATGYESKEGSSWGLFTNMSSAGLSTTPVKIVNSKFANNKSLNAGSALTIWTSGDEAEGAAVSHTISDSTFTGNESTNYGGAISFFAMMAFDNKGTTTTLDTVAFNGNKVTGTSGKGGAIYAEAQNVVVTGNSTFTGNSAYQGGAIYMGDASKLTLNAGEGETITFSGNTLVTKDADGKDLTGAAGSDLYLGDMNANPTEGDTRTAATAVFKGEGSIVFEGSIAGIEGSSITSSVANLSIADAADFAGSFTQTSGNTTIAGDKYFGGTVQVNGGTLTVTGDLVLTNEKTSVGTSGALTVGSLTLGKAATTGTTSTAAVKGSLTNSGTTTIDTLTFATTDSALTNSGKLYVDTVSTGKLASVTAENTGVIYTSVANLLTATASEDGKTTTYTATAFGTALKGDAGKVVDESYTGTFTAAQYGQLTEKVGNVDLHAATLVGADAEGNATAATFDDAKAVGYAVPMN